MERIWKEKGYTTVRFSTARVVLFGQIKMYNATLKKSLYYEEEKDESTVL